MKQLLILTSVCIVIFSCNNISVEEAEFKPIEHNLSFIIETVDYSNILTDTTSLTCKQDLDKGLVSTEETNYIFSSGGLSSSLDSIYLKNSLTFRIEDQDAFIYGTFEISFSYIEARTNLINVTDTTYNYKDLLSFHKVLKDKKWDSKIFSQEYEKDQFSIAVPESATDNWHNENIQSNGFIIDYEHMELTDVLYHEDTGAIEIAGDFEVSLKIFSCGYYEFYRIKEGTFTAIIHP